jgi:AraC-like DNA-binding protein/mannose-6-phosphate isomerase-like protein (cupin superfamily)
MATSDDAGGPSGRDTTSTRWLRNANREVITADTNSGFRWATHGYPEPGVAQWNYHPEYELHAIRESEGRWVLGDKVGVFAPGHVALVGPNLPHDWISVVEPGQYIDGCHTLIQFTHEWFAACVELMPELGAVAPRLEQSRHGIVFRAGTARRLASALDRIGATAPMERLEGMIGALRIIAEAPDDEIVLIGARYSKPAEIRRRSMPAVDVGLDYIFKNIHREVSLEEAARLANMSASAFSRYFKRASGLTFTEMTIKLRVSQACRLLDLSDDPVSDIAIQVGYANQSNFNRQFRRLTGTSPRDYRLRVRERRLSTDAYTY